LIVSEKKRRKMLKVYGVKGESSYLDFYLIKSDAEMDVEEREEDCEVVPIVIREEYKGKTEE